MTPDFLKRKLDNRRYYMSLIPVGGRHLGEILCSSFGFPCYVFYHPQCNYCRMSHVLLHFDLQKCYCSHWFLVCYLQVAETLLDILNYSAELDWSLPVVHLVVLPLQTRHIPGVCHMHPHLPSFLCTYWDLVWNGSNGKFNEPKENIIHNWKINTFFLVAPHKINWQDNTDACKICESEKWVISNQIWSMLCWQCLFFHILR